MFNSVRNESENITWKLCCIIKLLMKRKFLNTKLIVH